MTRLGVTAAGRTALGRTHETNEDSYAIAATQDGAALLVLCDGMGGMGRGDLASTCAVAAFLRALTHAGDDPEATIRRAVHFADTAVREALCTGPGKRHPGSTAVLALVLANTAYIGWVGDSRAYLVRDGQLVARTRDHRVIEGLIATGAMTREEAERSPMANVLSRGLGARAPSDETVEPDLLEPLPLRVGDWLLLCCDGVIERLGDDDIVRHLGDGNPIEVATTLRQAAIASGSRDDITLVVARIVEDDGKHPILGAGWPAP